MSTATLSVRQSASYKWYVLALGAFTFTFVIAIPTMSLPVLFDKISQELNLNLVQIGWIWGIGSLMGIVIGLVGGPISDRFGSRLTLSVACLVMGIVGAARGLTWNFASLATTMFLLGIVQSLIPMNVHKTCRIWFAGPRLGMANGVVSLGMALGFMLGSLLAATVISPLLGGWRNVLFVYGAVALLFSLLWWLSEEKIAESGDVQDTTSHSSLSASLRHVASIRNVWLIGLATLGVGSCVTAFLGYLPLYLRDLGWEAAQADSALASFHAASMCAAIPIALLSDRLGVRRGVLMVGALMVASGVGLLTLVHGQLIWLAVIIAGVTRDGFMAITMTAAMEVKGVGARYAASATGFVIACSGLGNVIAPPLGNSMASISASAPFVLWSGLAAFGFCMHLLMKQEA